MNPKIEHFLAKYDITPADIKCILREDGKTQVCTIDGRVISTYHPVKEFREYLSQEEFFYPNKGILLAASQIVDVSDGAYTLADGQKFKYRVHNSKLHDTRMLQMGRKLESIQAVADALPPDTIPNRFAILDKLPMAVSVIEMIFDEHGMGADFIFRYVNEKMALLEKTTVQQLMNRSCLEMNQRPDPKWLVVLADVALNDTVRIIDDYHTRLGRDVRAYCYQPMPGFCVSVMTETEPKTTHEIHMDTID